MQNVYSNYYPHFHIKNYNCRCSLGDVTNSDACYEKALEVSNDRSARAKVIWLHYINVFPTMVHVLIVYFYISDLLLVVHTTEETMRPLKSYGMFYCEPLFVFFVSYFIFKYGPLIFFMFVLQ